MNHLVKYIIVSFLLLISMQGFAQYPPPAINHSNDTNFSESKIYVDISSTVGHEKDVEELVLLSRGLDSLPREVLTLINLRKLNLDQNNIRCLPKGLSNLRHLEDISIRNNRFTEVSSELWQVLRAVKRIDFLGNQIVDVGNLISVSNNIEKLNLGFNRIDSLPASFSNLQGLTFLNLEGNKLTKLPLSVLSLKSLDTLWLSSNCRLPRSSPI